jgi:hypothetical protein
MQSIEVLRLNNKNLKHSVVYYFLYFKIENCCCLVFTIADGIIKCYNEIEDVKSKREIKNVY